MEKYKPPYTISEQMLNLVSAISEKAGKIESFRSFDSKPQLRRNNRIRSIHSSLKIEANSLSLDEVRDVIDGKAVIGQRTEIQEVKNAYEAYRHLSEMDPFSMDDLLKAHGIMEQYLKPDAGRFRLGNEGVFHGDTCIFMAPPPDLVPSLMTGLFDWMKMAEGKIHPLLMSAIFHYEFVFIHPFSDGNGRTARLWHTALLMQWNPLFAYIPLESQIERFQEDYYNAISRCHAAGNSNYFIEFMLEKINEILGEAMEQLQTADSGISLYVKRLLQVMEPQVPYTAYEIMNLLHLRSKETFRKNYLNPAMEIGAVAMTIPDKPNSRNQRYIRR